MRQRSLIATLGLVICSACTTSTPRGEHSDLLTQVASLPAPLAQPVPRDYQHALYAADVGDSALRKWALE